MTCKRGLIKVQLVTLIGKGQFVPASSGPKRHVNDVKGSEKVERT